MESGKASECGTKARLESKGRTGQGNRESFLILVRLLEVVIMAEIYQSVYPSLVIWQEKVQYGTE